MAFAVGFYGPNLYLKNLDDKRRTTIMRAFPDSLDMMLICVESGMSIELAFARVGEEIGTASVELAEELALTTAELSYLPGPPRRPTTTSPSAPTIRASRPSRWR